MGSAGGHVAILGAGPTGLEAALACVDTGRPFIVYEAAPEVAGSVRQWGHVRLFTPWDMNVSPRMARHLAAGGMVVPSGDELPTGHELVERLLAPVAALPALQGRIRLGSRVDTVGRQGLLKHEEIASADRASRPFRLLVESGGAEEVAGADVVLDCTGTYHSPNPLGDGGIPAPGERSLAAQIRRHLPDLRAEGDGWAGRSILLVGAGASAQTAAAALAELVARAPGTTVTWVVRHPEPTWGAVTDDPLPARASLAAEAERLRGGGQPGVEVYAGTAVEGLARRGSRVAVTLRRGAAAQEVVVDRVLSLTGFVGDHHLYRQLQVHECYATSAPMDLSAALLGSGAGDCLEQTGHGSDVLANPEPGFFILGIKSYGRVNQYLLRIGWDQVSEVFGLLDRPQAA
ncbi:MAG TPA: FAD-dependent oxidoreductase [Acidimicrobiales bacterium]|jgi:cation diffusion facilitator CzcD-associated flavoprotein CzcO|nr:FAD-dependent oxidoreductase [Acidimicrobiales bacterium]